MRLANDEVVAGVPGPGSSLISCCTLPSAPMTKARSLCAAIAQGRQVLDLDAVVVPDIRELGERPGEE